MRKLLLSLFTLATAMTMATPAKVTKFVQENFTFAEKQMATLVAIDPIKDGYPRTTNKKGKLVTTKRSDWTEGFFPGNLWYLYENNRSNLNLENALKWTLPLKQLQFLKSHHDIGFLMYCSYGNAYRLTSDKDFESIIIQSAKSLCTRFDPITGVIKSWNYRESWDKKHKWHFPVIIDNMMNLELLYAATRLTGDSTYAHIATRHAEVTMANHIRPDNSTYHVVNYDPKTGAVLFSGTCQGYADNSTWARGQAWAIYGYTLVYRETRDKRFLDCAQRLSEYWLSHPNMPKDLVPYWDFNVIDKDCPPADWALKRTFDKNNPPRDASAAAITSSALFELSQYVNKKESRRYQKAAIRTLESLASPAYRAELGSNNGFLLKHSVGSIPHVNEVDEPLVYADYYFLEALLRYQQSYQKADSQTLINTIFTNSSYSALQTGVTMKNIKNITDSTLRRVATQLYDKNYDSRLVIKTKAIIAPEVLSDTLRIGSGFSRYQNITGIYLPAGKAVVYAHNIGSRTVKLLLPNWMRQPTEGFQPTKDPKGWGVKCQSIVLTDGANLIDVSIGTLAYVEYFDRNPNKQPELTLNFPTGLYNGYFDAAQHSDAEWNKLLDNAVAPTMDAVGRFIQVAYPIEFFKKFAYNRGNELIDNYDRMLLSHYRFMGLEKYNLIPENKILARVNFNYYMFRDHNGVAYLGDERTMRMVTDPERVIKGDPCWGFSHEVGHVLQMRPQLTWGGMTEVSNNLFTLFTTTGLGNDSRIKKQNNYAKARASIIESSPRISYLQDSDPFNRLIPLWQLHLYFARNGKADFYADLMNQFRQQPNAGTGDNAYKNMFDFVKATCDYAQLDLTDFFDKWGFFYVGEIKLNDYANYHYKISQEEVDAIKQYIASKKYPKPSIDITTLEDEH